MLLPANQVTLSGTIRPQHVVGVGAQVDGVVDAFLVDVGQDVYQGQVLVRIGSQGLDSSREAAASAVDVPGKQLPDCTAKFATNVATSCTKSRAAW